MTQEEKQLLLRDLCARQPYGVKFRAENGDDPVELHYVRDEDVYGRIYSNLPYWIETIKPYLRPISSMTEVELREAKELGIYFAFEDHIRVFDGFGNVGAKEQLKALDWLNSHQFDYRGLIPLGLALEAKEGMYKKD